MISQNADMGTLHHVNFSDVHILDRLKLEEYIQTSMTKVVKELYRNSMITDEKISFSVSFRYAKNRTMVSCSVRLYFGDFFSFQFTEESRRANHAFNKVMEKVDSTLLSKEHDEQAEQIAS